MMITLSKLGLKTFFYSILISTTVLSTGCSSKIVSTIQNETPIEGVSYFLPTNNIRIVFTNSTIASEIKVATKVLNTAQKSVKDSEKSLESAKKARGAAKPTTKPDEIKLLDKAVKVAQENFNKASASFQAAQSKLDETKKKNLKS